VAMPPNYFVGVLRCLAMPTNNIVSTCTVTIVRQVETVVRVSYCSLFSFVSY